MSFETEFSPIGIAKAIREIQDRRTDTWDRLFGRSQPRIRVPPGIDRVPFSAFLTQKDKKLEARRDQLIERLSVAVLSGNYRFQPFYERLKDKGAVKPRMSLAIGPSDSKKRTLSICAVRDAIVQHITLKLLKASLEETLSPCCYGYRTGRSASLAVKRIRTLMRKGWIFAYESDIRKFFDRVPHERLIEILRERLPEWDPRAMNVLVQFVKSKYIKADNFDSKGRLPKGVRWREIAEKRTQGLPQGGALSGFLTNLYLAKFDEEFQNNPSVRMFRYADDFVILGRDEAAVKAAKVLAENSLIHSGLELHPDKSHFLKLKKQPLDFLGYRLRMAGNGEIATKIKPETLKRRYYLLLGLFIKAREKDVCPFVLAHRLSCKSLGLEFDLLFPDQDEAEKKLRALGLQQAPSRSWLRYFRLINSTGQLRELDIWVKKKLVAHRRLVRETHSSKCELCKTNGLPLRTVSYCDVFYYLKQSSRH